MSNNSVLRSFVWKFLERAGTQIVNLIVQVILARLISPSEFGSLAILIVFLNIANIFIQKGLSSSIIRKKEADNMDYDTAFWTSMIVAFLLYVFLFFISPIVAEIYNSPILSNGLRVFSLQFFIGSFYCIQNAIMVREMLFKSIFVRGMVSSIGSGIVGIYMAYLGYGLWALIIYTILNQTLCCLTALISVKWMPRFRFSKYRLDSIISFGGKILISELLNYSAEALRTLAIGRVYSTEALSYYDRGQLYPSTLMRGIYDTIGGVLLPVFSKKQDDDRELGLLIIKSSCLIFFVTTPVFLGMAAVSDSLVLLLLTEKWAGAIPFFAIFSVYWIPYPIQGIFKSGMYAKGISDMVLKIEFSKTIITFITLTVALFISPLAIAIAAIISMVMTTALYIILLKDLLHFSLKTMFDGMYKTLISAIAMYMIVRIMGQANLGYLLTLIVQVITGVIVYIILSIILKDKNLIALKSVLMNKTKSRNIKKI